MFEEEKTLLENDPRDFQGFVRTLRQSNKAVYEVVVRSLPHRSWHKMVDVLEKQKPDLYFRLQEMTEALRSRSEHVASRPGLGTPQAALELSWDIIRNYDCTMGAVDDVPAKQTALVHLKIPNVVRGLPKDILKVSNYLARDYGGERKWTFGFDNRQFAVDLEDAAIEELYKSPLVDRVVINPMATIMSTEIPTYNPAGINTCWGNSRINVTFPWGVGNFGRSLTGRRIKVCVVDTGIKPAHEVFWKDGVCVYKGGHNFVSGGDNPADDHDHGTYCCSIVAMQHNGIVGSYRGIAPDIDLYACKVLDSKGSGSFTNIAAGVDWARTNGMDIISMSLGGASGAAALESACNAAWYAGILVIAAAGNSGPGENTVNYPAKYSSVLCVAASDFDDNIAGFSSRGPESEVTAPGRYITGAWAGFTYNNYVVVGSNNKYFCASGTSAACPHVAAGAALLKAWYPAMTMTEMREWLRACCRDL